MVTPLNPVDFRPQLAVRHVALTGASSGIGAALTRAYAAPGVRLSLLARDCERLATVAAAAAARGADVVVTSACVTDADAMNRWVLASDNESPIDVLLANAGIGGNLAVAPPTGEDFETARRIFEINTLGVVNTLTPLLPRLCARGHGRIGVVASLAGGRGLPHSPAYCGSKAAVRTYAEGLRALLRRQGVTVTVIDPGFVATPMALSLPYAKPMIWDADRAARTIRAAVDGGARTCRFPRALAALIGLSRLLPESLVDAILAFDHRRGVGS